MTTTAPSPRSRRRPRPGADRQRGDIVLGWLTRVTLVIALGGVVLFDGIAVAVAHVQATDHAGAAARAASEAWQDSKDPQRAFAAAASALDPASETVDPARFSIDPDGRVHVTVQHNATTLVLFRLGSLARYTEATGSGSALAVQ